MPPRKSTSEALGSSPRWLRGDTFESSKVHFFTLWPFWAKMGPSAKKLMTFRASSTIKHRTTPKVRPGPFRGGAKSGTFSHRETFSF